MKKNIIIFLILHSYLFLSAQNITINPISINDQLPSTTVQRIYQDREGFVWFGTPDGLCRYDGYRIIETRSKFNRDNLLRSNEITCFAEDKDHLWIGTKAGVNIINKRNYQIIQFDDVRLNDVEIRCLLTTSDGYIWIGANNRLFKYDSKLNYVKDYSDVLPIHGINSLYEDADRNIWVTIWDKGLYRYDIEKDRFVGYPVVGDKNNPFKIFQDKEKRYWICTWGEGIYLFRPDITTPEKSTYTFQEIHSQGKPIKENTFFSVVQDDRCGYLWFVSISGIYACKHESNRGLEVINLSHLFKESNNIFSEIIKDRSGNLWIGTFGEGVLNINFDMPVVQNYALSSIKQQTGITPNITKLFVDKDDIIWLNQNRKGLALFDVQKGDISYYEDLPGLKNIKVLNVVSCIYGPSFDTNTIWIGPENEPSIYEVRKERGNVLLEKKIDLTKIVDDPGNPRKFYEDARTNIWIVTTDELFIKPANKREIEHVQFDFGYISDIKDDVSGNIWISTRNKGIYKIKLLENSVIRNDQIMHFAKETGCANITDVEAIAADKDGDIWIGTKLGNIILYDTKKNEFIEKASEIGMTGDAILNILIDNYGHIWISTNKRIVEYNPDNSASQYYSLSDGVLVNSFSQESYFKSRSGKIYFGGNKGISVFQSSNKLSETPSKKKAYVTDIKINNKSVFESNNNQFDITEQSVVLNPNDKNIEFDFSSLDYTHPNKIRYAYKMEGVDDDWIYTEEKYQFAIYNQLKTGSYTLLVRSTDENRLWSGEVSRVKIYKRPAFYETWWAYCIYFVILLTIAWFIYKVIKNRIVLRNNLKIAQIEKEKSEELTQTKLKYFTNISHDFLTPLTILSCLIDDAELTYKDKVTQFGSMRSNINRLKRLLQQVLDFRKVESGNMRLKIMKGDIAVFVTELCYSSFLPLMKKKNIAFSFNVSSPHVEAYFDADKVDKIIYNLLSNAYKYTPENGMVQIDLTELDYNNQPCVSIRVADAGVGISKDDLSNIFTRFYSNKINISSESNGIGLSLTKDLVEIHKGSICAESEIGKGSVFTVIIPIGIDCYNKEDLNLTGSVVIPQRDVEVITAPGVVEESPLQQENDTNILVVEDNEELLQLMKNILSKQYNIIISRNGHEALELVESHKIDIIISDVMMPKMDGLELCRRMKQRIETSHIPIILLTAKSNAEDRIECYNAGANGYIAKPFDLKVLEARINNFISTKKIQQQEFRADVNINLSMLEFPSIDEQFLNNAIKIIEENLLEPSFDVLIFSEKLNMSKSSLYRKLKNMTGLSASDFIRNIRLKRACVLLKSKTASISEVAYSVGFSDPKYFSLCFKNEFNMTPSEYQKGEVKSVS